MAVATALLVISLACFWLMQPSVAHAHSRLVRSEPPAGSILTDEAPREIRLFLSEPIGLQFSSIKLYDRARREQPLGTLQSIPGGKDSAVQVAISKLLEPGPYIVTWRIVSAVDGHLTAGSFAFRVRGSGDAGASDPGSDEVFPEGSLDVPLEGVGEDPGPLRWLARGVILIAASFLLGGAIFSVLVVEPTALERGRAGGLLWSVLGSRFSIAGALAACLLVVGLFFDLMAQAASAAGTGLLEALARDDLARLLLTSTRYGFAWVLKIIAGVLLMAMMLFVWGRGKAGNTGLWEIAIAAGSLMLLAEALSSHAAAAQGAEVAGLPLPVVSDWLHLVTAATWAGGLGYMGLVLFPAFKAIRLSPEERRDFLGRAVPRFSRLAVASVVVLTSTGTYNLFVHSMDLTAIVGSAYGQVLAVKVALFVALAALGAVNLLRLSGRLRASPTSSQAGSAVGLATVPRLVRNVRVEIALASLALLCAGGLTLLPPPSGQGSSYASSPQPIESTGQSENAATAQTTSAGHVFALTARTGEGSDELSVSIEASDEGTGAWSLADVIGVLFRVTPQEGDVISSAYQAQKADSEGVEGQVWRASGQALSQPGSYLINLLVRRSHGSDLRAAFMLRRAQDGGINISAWPVVQVRVETAMVPPIAGDVRLAIELMDAAGAPVEASRVAVTASMPSRGIQQPGVNATAVPGKPGTYVATVPLSVPGGWRLVFDLESAGYSQRIDASLAVGEPQP